MTKITWGAAGERVYETGTDRGVLYLDGTGLPWNGLVSVAESPSGGEPTPYYIDGVKYLNRQSLEEFSATLEAYTYPDEFAVCDGTASMAKGLSITQQSRKEFGLAYRTKIGNDIDGVDHGYKIHIIYNALASPTSRDYKTQTEDTELLTFSWKIETRPELFQDDSFGIRYGAHIVLDSREVYPWAMTAIEDLLYGTDTAEPHLPSPTELLTLFNDNALLKIVDNGDGTWTATGPDEAISVAGSDVSALTADSTDSGFYTTTLMEDPADPGFYTMASSVSEDSLDPGFYNNNFSGTFTIQWPSAIQLTDDTYQLSSL